MSRNEIFSTTEVVILAIGAVVAVTFAILMAIFSSASSSIEVKPAHPGEISEAPEPGGSCEPAH